MSATTPDVSIVLPTHNRAHTLRRAIDSVLAQTFEDYELIVVDDGSTDSTADLDDGSDPRVRWIRQENQGVYAARNTGVAASRARLITFLDSDDAWLPHALGLAVAFLRSSPAEHWVVSEFIADNSEHPALWYLITHTHVPNAARVGSSALDLPDAVDDDYLRIYERREPFGEWAAPWLPDDRDPDAAVYRGDISPHVRWGYLAWLPTVVLTRHALETVGPFDATRRSAADYHYTSRLAQHFPANLISLVAARKHELAPDGTPLNHLAIGAAQYRAHVNLLHFFDRLHEGDDDPELVAIRKRHEYEVGVSALQLGKRDEAIAHFGRAASLDRHGWRGHVMRALAFACGTGAVAERVYDGAQRGARTARRALPGR